MDRLSGLNLPDNRISYEFEKQTRKLRIDALLAKAGWKILPYCDQLEVAYLCSNAMAKFLTIKISADYNHFGKGHLFKIVETAKFVKRESKLFKIEA